MVFCPEHPKRDQNLKFTPLSETTSIPAPFIWESPPGSAETLPSDSKTLYSSHPQYNSTEFLFYLMIPKIFQIITINVYPSN